MSAHWSNYWASGYCTSLPQDFTANYDGELAAFWQQQFERLPRKAPVLDVCTGNGAIALLAAAWSDRTGHELTITAVDAAQMDPAALAARNPAQARLLQGIRFLGNQPLETLQLPDAQFDLVCSQYGIEYCAWAPAAAQVYRVLKPGGRFAMVCHAPSTDIVATMRAELEEYQWLETQGFGPATEAFLHGMDDYPLWREKLGAVHAAASERHAKQASPFMHTLVNTLGAMLGLPEAELRANLDHLRDFHRHLQHGRARLADMFRVNQAIHDDPDWHRVFEAAGLAPADQGEILYQGRHRSGRWYCFDRLAA